jgi:hypothetical protein
MKSDRVLLDLRKTRVPDAPQTVQIKGELTVDDLLIKAAERKRGRGSGK